MKFYQLAYVVIAMACAGCFSKEAPSSNATSATTASASRIDSASMPEELRSLRFAVIQHTGEVTDWRITMQDFAIGFKKWAHPDSKFVWERDSKESWILRFNRFDKATQAETKMVLVFQKRGNKAVLSRLVMNNEEYFQQYISTVVNDLVFNVLKTINKLEDSQRLPASE